MKQLLSLLLLVFIATSSTCQSSKKEAKETKTYVPSKNESSAVFASGCFWCVEAVFESVEGVNEVVSGYCGDKKDYAKYDLVSDGLTNHAESVKVYYDSTKINYNTLLQVFFGSHDATTLNRQGPDGGRQYRSAIFCKDENEKLAAEAFVENLYQKGDYTRGSITTEIVINNNFYSAEDYHQDYERNNPDNPYIQGVSIPRLKKFQSKFPALLKKGGQNH
jgi:peptide-methionine (S)-S-oxide reductase